MNSLNTIPNEIILLILDNFESTSDLKIAKAICKKWRDSVNYFMKSKRKCQIDIKIQYISIITNHIFPNYIVNAWTARQIRKALKTSMIIVGGIDQKTPRHVAKVCRNLIIGPAKLDLPDLPYEIGVYDAELRPSMVVNDSGELLYCGLKNCWVLRDHKWNFHSEFAEYIFDKVVVQMSNGTYAFGGYTFDNQKNQRFCQTSYFLPNGSKQWETGPSIPYYEFSEGSALAISSTELILVGGKSIYGNGAILKFNIITNDWTVVGNLQEAREGCFAAIFNQKIIVCNGRNYYTFGDDLKSTEILPFKIKELPSGEKVAQFMPIRKGGDTNSVRCHGAIGVVQLEDSEKLVKLNLFQPAEEWNDETETWHISTHFASNPLSHSGRSTAFISKATHLLPL